MVLVETALALIFATGLSVTFSLPRSGMAVLWFSCGALVGFLWA